MAGFVCGPEDLELYRNFEFREDDIFIMGFPRSGTTIMETLLWIVVNDFNFPLLTKTARKERVPVLESPIIKIKPEMKKLLDPYPKMQEYYLRSHEILNSMTKQRVIKTHLHFEHLPKNILTKGWKIIYMVRNPKDVAVSHYHYNLQFLPHKDFGSFLKHYMSSSYCYGTHFSHLNQAWEQRHSENMLIIHYEDLIQNKKKWIVKIFDFLNIKVTPFQVDILDFLLRIDNFRKCMGEGVEKEHTSEKIFLDKFIRKGEIGNSANYFSDELGSKFDEWVKTNFKATDFYSQI